MEKMWVGCLAYLLVALSACCLAGLTAVQKEFPRVACLVVLMVEKLVMVG